MFNESCYQDCVVEGQPLKILKPNVDPRADTLMSWVDACYEALERRFLRQAVLAVYNSAEDPTVRHVCER